MGIRHELLGTACIFFAVSGVHAYAQTGAIDLVQQEKAREAQKNTPEHPYRQETDYEGNALPERAPPIHHLLYIATPGGGDGDRQSGMVVLDADHDYRFIKRIPWGVAGSEVYGDKVTGIAASVPLNMVYVTFISHMIGIDLKTDKVVWTFNGEPGGTVRHFKSASSTGCCERPWTLPDGKTLLVGSSYNNWWYYINGATGEPEGKVITPDSPVAHNMSVSPDGKIAMLGSETPTMSIVDVPARRVLRTITFTDSVRPLTINHDGGLVYATLNNLDGFEIGDTKTGKMIKRLELPGEMWKAKWADPTNHFFGHSNPSHGIGVTPDESEIWVSDDVNVAWEIWDNPGNGRNPVYNPAKTIKVTPGVSSSWISMTNDGKLAFLGDGSVVDVKAHKVIGQLKDEYGNRIPTVEKDLYFTFQGGKLIETNNQFAVGDPKAYEARMAQKNRD
jgi:hypothetical protein